MLFKTLAELTIEKRLFLSTALEVIGNPIIAMLIGAFVAYYLLGIKHHQSMESLLKNTEKWIYGYW